MPIHLQVGWNKGWSPMSIYPMLEQGLVAYVYLSYVGTRVGRVCLSILCWNKGWSRMSIYPMSYVVWRGMSLSYACVCLSYVYLSNMPMPHSCLWHIHMSVCVCLSMTHASFMSIYHSCLSMTHDSFMRIMTHVNGATCMNEWEAHWYVTPLIHSSVGQSLVVKGVSRRENHGISSRNNYSVWRRENDDSGNKDMFRDAHVPWRIVRLRWSTRTIQQGHVPWRIVRLLASRQTSTSAT